VASRAGLVTVGEPGRHREGEMEANDLVGNDRRQEARRAGGIGIQAGKSRHGLDDVVIRRFI